MAEDGVMVVIFAAIMVVIVAAIMTVTCRLVAAIMMPRVVTCLGLRGRAGQNRG